MSYINESDYPVLNKLWQTEPYPRPDLSAEDVVMIQLDALQNNDISDNNNGIRIAYKFASPISTSATKTVENFIQIVKNPTYRLMIGFERAKLGQMKYEGNMASQQVQVFHHNGEAVTYLFSLSQQSEGQHKGCWLVDGVERLK